MFLDYPVRDWPNLGKLGEATSVTTIGTRVLCQYAQFMLHCQNTRIANRATTWIVNGTAAWVGSHLGIIDLAQSGLPAAKARSKSVVKGVTTDEMNFHEIRS